MRILQIHFITFCHPIYLSFLIERAASFRVILFPVKLSFHLTVGESFSGINHSYKQRYGRREQSILALNYFHNLGGSGRQRVGSAALLIQEIDRTRGTDKIFSFLPRTMKYVGALVKHVLLPSPFHVIC
ncbi:hypothetical protein CEXT_32771 [Caerostris extrusa]|uniref:Uncharacterized protein n=1 Tax=Caerostris extrusa TaxID=172846 RepID=A0AAV4SK92_CAEEX|nr:hypothetical protein CEXT_32771 [Caerostris extrusa]